MFDPKMLCLNKCDTCAQGFNVGFEHYASVVLRVLKMRWDPSALTRLDFLLEHVQF